MLQEVTISDQGPVGESGDIFEMLLFITLNMWPIVAWYGDSSAGIWHIF